MSAPTLSRTRASVPPSPAGGTRHLTTRALGFLVSLAVLALVVLASLRIGSVPLSTDTVIAALRAPDGSNAHLIVTELRLPRTIIGLGVGAALAVAGVSMQAVTRNPLASPTILGVNAGASFAIVVAVFLLDVVRPTGYIWFAFAGALAASVVVYVIGSAGRAGATPVKLALAGAVVTALLQAWISGILVLSESTLDEVRFWLAGSLAGRDLALFAQVAPFLVVGLVVSVLLAKQFDAISLGDDVAVALGQRTGLTRAVATVGFVLLAGSSVAAAGPIAFVGLAVPHAVRSVIGPGHRWLLPYCVVWGPVLLLSSDIIGRVIARPSEVQVGIVTAIVGAPFLIHLVRRRTVGAS